MKVESMYFNLIKIINLQKIYRFKIYLFINVQTLNVNRFHYHFLLLPKYYENLE